MSKSAHHELYLIVYHRALFKAHWALFVPSLQDPNIGKRLDASGDVRSGFHHEVTVNFHINLDDRSHSRILLGTVADEYCTDEPLGQELILEQPTLADARDQLERVILEIPTPGPSLRRGSRNHDMGSRSAAVATDEDRSEPMQRVQIKDCQDWIKDVITVLCERGILNTDAMDTVRSAPAH